MIKNVKSVIKILLCAIVLICIFGGCGDRKSRQSEDGFIEQIGESEEIEKAEKKENKKSEKIEEKDNTENQKLEETQKNKNNVNENIKEAVGNEDKAPERLEETGKKDIQDDIDTANIEISEKQSINYKENCAQLIKDIEGFEYVCLYYYYDVDEKRIDFTLDDTEKARLATITAPNDFEIEGEGEELRCFPFGPTVDEHAMKIFGTKVDFNALPEQDMFAEKMLAGDVIHPVLYIYNVEDEGLYEIIKQDIRETSEGYDVVQNLYCGYWGEFDGEHGNYDVTFHLKKDNSTYYGVVLTSMSFNKIAKSSMDILKGDVSTSDTPFYGIWCASTKDEESAKKVVEDIENKGEAAYIYISSDWGNLNPEKWYVVTAGVYSNEADAKAVLPNVKSIGYNNAYVKYSGEYKGR